MSGTAVQTMVEARLTVLMQDWLPPVAAGCKPHLLDLIRQAALRVEAEGFATDQRKLAEAETNFRTLLTEMTLQAKALGFNELQELTFFNSLARLCPIWPFC